MIGFPTFMADHNRRFAKPPKNANDLHRSLSANEDSTEISTTRHERTLTSNLTLHYDRMILEPNATSRPLAGKRVMIVNYPDGRFAVQHRGRNLAYRVFDKIQTVQSADIIENKRLSETLAPIQEQQAAFPAHKRPLDPERRQHANNLEIPATPAT